MACCTVQEVAVGGAAAYTPLVAALDPIDVETEACLVVDVACALDLANEGYEGYAQNEVEGVHHDRQVQLAKTVHQSLLQSLAQEDMNLHRVSLGDSAELAGVADIPYWKGPYLRYVD
jgi:hypothetical protein